MRLPELQDDNKEAIKLRSEGLLESWEDIEQVLYYQDFPYILRIIRSELRSKHHDDPLAGHFGIEKTCELIAKKYYWPTLRQDIKAYVKDYNVCLASKTVRHKPYGKSSIVAGYNSSVEGPVNGLYYRPSNFTRLER